MKFVYVLDSVAIAKEREKTKGILCVKFKIVTHLFCWEIHRLLDIGKI